MGVIGAEKTQYLKQNMKFQKWTVGLATAGLVGLVPSLVAQTPGGVPQLVPIETALSATTISGYVDTSAIWNPGTGNAHPAPFAFNAGKQDGFNLDSMDVKISRSGDDTKWSAGYVAELNYGPDAAMDGGAYPIRQAFVQLKVPFFNGIDFQLGRWDKTIGFEANDSYMNPNFTRSYSYTFEPTEHTGLLGAYTYKALTFQLGVADTVTPNGLNSRTDGYGTTVVESKKALLASVTLTAPDSWGGWKGSTLEAGWDLGQGYTDYGAGSGPMYSSTAPHNRSEIYVGAKFITPIKDLTFGLCWDAIQHNDIVMYYQGQPFGPGDTFPGAVDASYFQSIAGYISYKPLDRLKLSGRVEYASGMGLGVASDSQNGFGVDSAGNLIPNPLHRVLDLTATVEYSIWENVTSRVEVRWDRTLDGTDAFGGDTLYDSLPNSKNSILIGANVIYKF